MALLDLTRGGVIADAGTLQEISLAEWRAGARPEGRGFAIVLPAGAAPDELGADIHNFDAAILEFPAFRDGRAYSQAMLLRGRLGFRGEIRARGAIVSDQALFMARAGFTSIEGPAEMAAAVAAALAAYSVFYQPAAGGAAPAFALRAARARAA